MFYVYKFIDKNNDVLYVGQSIDIDRRIREHQGKIWDIEKDRIEFAECKSCVDMCIYEMYYINKLQAKYNTELVYDPPTITLPELEWKEYNKDWKLEEEMKRVQIIRSLSSQKFAPENYWKNKYETLNDKLERLQQECEDYKSTDEYKKIIKDLDRVKNEIDKYK